MPKATRSKVSAALAALTLLLTTPTLLTACSPNHAQNGAPGSSASSPGNPPQSPASTPEKADDVSLVTLPTDEALVTRSGSGSPTKPIAGTFGPDYVLYARCRAGAVHVEIAGSDPWDVPCDGVPSRIKLLTDTKGVSLRLTTTPSTHWTFIVAKEKQPTR